VIDFAQARRTMVDGQVRVNDVTDHALIDAMLSIPRERFVPPARAALAYIDDDLEVAPAAGAVPARYLMEPMVLAKLLQALAPADSARVLDVGGATGYAAAVIARVSGSVVALEENPALAAQARVNIAALELKNVTCVEGPLATGWALRAPYDVILLNGAAERIPEALLTQLADGGRLGAVIRKDRAAKAMLFARNGSNISTRHLFDAAVPPLPGFELPATFVF
jgi:protein-L-isoaspartate(D-aspartate) O-methyltransferase